MRRFGRGRDYNDAITDKHFDIIYRMFKLAVSDLSVYDKFNKQEAAMYYFGLAKGMYMLMTDQFPTEFMALRNKGEFSQFGHFDDKYSNYLKFFKE